MSDLHSLRILIADDEALARRRLRRLIEAEGCEVLAELQSAAEVMSWLKENPQPDALFLDIQMPGLTGLELVPELEDPPPIVFVTAYVQFAVQAFDAAAVDYLVKPVTEDRLRRCLDRLRKHQVPSRKGPELSRMLSGGSPRVAVKAGEGTLYLELRKITHFEVEKEVVYAWAVERFRTSWTTLAEVEQAFPDARLLRLQRHILVRVETVLGLRMTWNGKGIVRLAGGIEIEASRNAIPKLKAMMQV